MENFYTTKWSHPDVVLHFADVEGPMCNEESQQIVDFSHQPKVSACAEDQWHPLMWQSDSIPTAVFEAPTGTFALEVLRSYMEDVDNN
jgi:hypothetical protein